MMDNKFTEELGRFLDSDDKDYAEGALLLCRLTGNQIQYKRLLGNLPRYKSFIVEELKKHYNFRRKQMTHADVMVKVEKCEVIKEECADVRSGKRADHDELPEEIKQAYIDNLRIYRQIADLHSKLRLIVLSKATCKDADLEMITSDIIKLDKQRLRNWKLYDEYKPEQEEQEQTTQEERQEEPEPQNESK